MKTKKELNALKEKEVETESKKPRKLTDEELEQVSGGLQGGDTFEYVIVPGDSLPVIAQRYGTSVKTLCKLNDIKDTDLICAGNKLLVPR